MNSLLLDQELRPDAPVLVSEFWPGWFDHWFEPHHNVLSEQDFRCHVSTTFVFRVNFHSN